MIKTDEADYKYWINFEKNIPDTMRFKEYHVVDDILYWVTQEPFDEFDLRYFIDVLEDTYLKKAYIVVRDVSSYDLKKDMAKQVGVMVDLTDDTSIVWGKNAMTESIEVKEECKIPGTDVVLEKGDMIRIYGLAKRHESLDDGWDKYLNAVHASNSYKAYSKEFQKYGYKLFTMKQDNRVEANVTALDDSKNDFHPQIYYSGFDKKVLVQTTSYGALDVNRHQLFIKHVIEGNEAAKLFAKLMNDRTFWNSIPDTSEI